MINNFYFSASLTIGISLIIFAFFIWGWLRRQSRGTINMRKQADIIKAASKVYLKKNTILMVAVFLVLTILVMFLGKRSMTTIGLWSGGILCYVAIYLSMLVATDANVRVTEACRTSGIKKGHYVSMTAGLIFMALILGFTIIDIDIWYMILRVYLGYSPLETTETMLSFAVGASTVAFMARIGGGIFTKGADSAADTAGKAEFGLDEDHPANTAVTADNVGDNVGDIGGMGPDLFESNVATMLTLMLLSNITCFIWGIQNEAELDNYMMLPTFLSGVGAIASIIGVLVGRKVKTANIKGINMSLLKASVVTVIIAIMAILLIPNDFPTYFKHLLILGIVFALLVGLIVNIFTSFDFPFVKKIARMYNTSASNGLTQAVGQGYLSSGIIFAFIIAVLYFAISLVPIPEGSTPAEIFALKSHGIALLGMGMMIILGITLVVDFGGPVADNAGGIAETVGLDKKVREEGTDPLDAVGNTTAAICKGIAFTTATIAGINLLASYPQEVGMELNVNIFSFNFVLGLFSSVVFVGVIAYLLLNAVSVASDELVEEVRDQVYKVLAVIGFPGLRDRAKTQEEDVRFEEAKKALSALTFETIPRANKETGAKGIDPNRAVEIVTKASQKQTLPPILFAVIMTVGVRFMFGPHGAIGFMVGIMILALSDAVKMANDGGALDNAKKLIESMGLKNTTQHIASIIGDTFGDPRKDTLGVAFNILVKWVPLFLIMIS